MRTKLSYYKIVHRKFITNKIRKTQIVMNKPVYLGWFTLDMSTTVMCEFWYDYVKPNYGLNAKLCYIDTDSFIVYVKTDNI